MGWATYRSKWLEGLIEGRPRVLIHNGRLLEGVLRAERMTHDLLMAALRRVSSHRQTRVNILTAIGRT